MDGNLQSSKKMQPSSQDLGADHVLFLETLFCQFPLTSDTADLTSMVAGINFTHHTVNQIKKIFYFIPNEPSDFHVH